MERGLQWALGCAGNRQRHAVAAAQPAGRQDAGRRLDTVNGLHGVPASGWPTACAAPCRCTPVAVQRQVAGLEAGGHPGLNLVHLVEAGAAGVDAARVAIVGVLHSKSRSRAGSMCGEHRAGRVGSGAQLDAARAAVVLCTAPRAWRQVLLQASSTGADGSAAASCDEQPQQAACCQAERAPQHSTAWRGTVGSGPAVGGQPWCVLVHPPQHSAPAPHTLPTAGGRLCCRTRGTKRRSRCRRKSWVQAKQVGTKAARTQHRGKCRKRRWSAGQAG